MKDRSSPEIRIQFATRFSRTNLARYVTKSLFIVKQYLSERTCTTTYIIGYLQHTGKEEQFDGNRN